MMLMTMSLLLVKRMTIYEPNIDEWIYLIKGNHIEHCREQELALENNIIPVLERPDVYVDAERIRKGLSLQKYFDFSLLAWEKYQFAIMFGLFLRVPGAPYDDIYFHVTRDIMGRGSGIHTNSRRLDMEVQVDPQ